MKGVLVESDVIAEFLTAPEGEVPLLRSLLQAAPCFSSFIQAGEIYSAARDDEERRTVERALYGLKILGASARYAKTIGRALTSLASATDIRTAIVAAVAVESRLPIVTQRYAGRLAQIDGVRVVSALELKRLGSPDAVARALDEV